MPTARIPIDAAHRAASDAHPIGAVTGLQAALESQQNESVVVCLGDSITFGSLLGTTVGADFAPWPQILSWMTPRTVINSGVSGDTLQGMAARLEDDVFAHNPGTCIVMGGTNNIGALGETPDVAAARLPILTTSLLDRGIRPVYCAVTPRGGSAETALRAAVRDFNRLLMNHCATYGIQFIDTYTPFVDASGAHLAQFLNPDGTILHPTQWGYRRIAEVVNAALPELASDDVWRFPGETLIFPNPSLTVDGNSDGLADYVTSAVFNGATAANTLAAHPTAGNWQKQAKSGGADATAYTDLGCGNLLGSLVAGDVIEFAIDILTSEALDGNRIQMYLNCQNGSAVNLLPIPSRYVLPSYTEPIPTPMRARCRFTIPSGTVAMNWHIRTYGTGASDTYIGRIYWKKVA